MKMLTVRRYNHFVPVTARKESELSFFGNQVLLVTLSVEIYSEFL